jgi:tripartite-type tricarboxylate transporter receptor subunit TctC
MNRKSALTVAAFAVGTSVAAMDAAFAQSYPNQAVRLVVPFAPVGSTDVLGRLVAQRLTKGIGQNVIVENRAGGGTNIGAEMVARAPADGYTLLMTTTTQAINVTLYPKLNYDVVKDFAAVAPIATSPSVLVVHPSVPVKSVKDLITLVKAKPGTLTYASSGSGSTAHLAGELFKMSAGVDLVHIPYKGAGPAQVDLIGGHVHSMFGFTAGVLPHLKAGKLRAIGVTSSKRLPDMPDLPTLSEAGVPGYEVSVWYGVLAPAGTPADIVSFLNAEVAKSVKDLTPRFAELGAYPLSSSPQEFSKFIQDEIRKWGPVVKRSGAKVD